jgi:hypothetical protein
MGFLRTPDERTRDMMAMTPKKVTAETATKKITFLTLLITDISIIFLYLLRHQSFFPH